MANSYQFDPKFVKRHTKINKPEKEKLNHAFDGYKLLRDLMEKENDKPICKDHVTGSVRDLADREV